MLPVVEKICYRIQCVIHALSHQRTSLPTAEPRDELQQLVSVQVAAIRERMATIGRDTIRRTLLDTYQSIGGDLTTTRRICQVAVDIWVMEELARADLPGPDALKPYFLPTIRDVVARLVGRKFDQLTQ